MRSARVALALSLLLLGSGCQNQGPRPVDVTPVEAALPLAEDSTRFAVIGDSGTGGIAQRDVAARLAEAHARIGFDLVLMLGDNLYGRERPQDYASKFEAPYRALLDAGVEFRASLGNHDDPNQRFYELFHMDGERYYTFTRGDVAFFALDSNYMDARQLEWLEGALRGSRAKWKIAFFHHPLYSSGAKHGSELDLRAQLEPLFLEHGVQVVFAGHEHFYERIHPQHGIQHFVAGASAKLRRGNIRDGSPLTAHGLDTDHSFMLVEATPDAIYFEAISRKGVRVDAGVVRPAGAAPERVQAGARAAP